MKISGHYTFVKKIITYIILILTFLIGGAITVIVYKNTNNFYLTGFLAVLTILLSALFSYLHKSSYYRMSNSDRAFHEKHL